MIKRMIKDWLGITKIESQLFNIENDIMTIQEKQLGSQELEVVPSDPQLVHKKPMYEYIKDDADQEYGWYAMWKYGFAGPFKNRTDAFKYMMDKNIYKDNILSIELLSKHEIKVEKSDD